MAYPLKTWDGTQWVQVSSASTDLSIYYTQSAADAKFVSAVNNGMFLVKPTSVTGGTLGANGAITVGSGVTSVVVNGAFSSAYTDYEIIWSGGVMASSSNDSQLAMILNGATTANYSNFLTYWNGSSNLVAGSSGVSNWQWIGGGSTGSGLMQVKLYAPFLPVHTRMESGTYNSWNNGFIGNVKGWHTLSTSYTGFTVNVTGTGSMTGGTMRIYGYNNGA